jgi:hypothetical protein
MRGDQIKCMFLVTNLREQRRTLDMSIANISGEPRSFLVGSDGRRFVATDAEIGGVGRFMFNATQTLDSDLPVKASMTFAAPDGTMPELPAAISIFFWGDKDAETVVFRGISIVK